MPSYFLLASIFWLVLGVIFLFPRWSKGYPRMLVVLVLEFESRRGEILIFFATIQHNDRLLRAPTVAWVRTIRREPTREERAEVFPP